MKQHTILLVEDNFIAQKVGQTYFEQSNCQVDVASTAEKAMKLADTKQYDLIIMDIGLPDGDGREVTEKILRKSKLNNETNIVAVSAHAEEKSCLAVGIKKVFAKPMTADIARQILKTFLNSIRKDQ